MAISFDTASNSGYQAASSSYSWSHTCSGAYRCLVVSVALLNVANEVSTLTYNGVSLTKLRTDVDGTGTIRTDIYYLVNPAQGSNTVAVTLNSASVSASNASSYAGVDVDNPIDAQAGTTGTTGAGGGSSSLSITSLTSGAVVVDALATTDTSINAATGQNERNNVTGAVGSGGQSDKTTLVVPQATTMAWNNIGALLNWTASAVALRAMVRGTTTSTSSTSISSTSISSTSSSTSSTSTSLSTSSTSISTTSKSTSTSSTSLSTSSTSTSISSTSSSTSSTSTSSTSTSTSISSTSSSTSSTSTSSTSTSSTSSSTSISSTSTSFSSTSSSISSTSASTSSTSISSTSSSTSTSTTTIPSNLDYTYQDSQDISLAFTKSGTWIAPAGVTSVTVQAWGGGGGGGGFNSGGGVSVGSGGGGGGFSKKVITVVPGTVYTVTVGKGGEAGLASTSPTDGGLGGDSWFSSNVTILAKGGTGGAQSGGAAGAGGAAGSGIGDTTTSGGAGAVGVDGVNSGGGGGSGGDTSDGGAASGATAGAAGTTNGAKGGFGRTSSGKGQSGKDPGGGGGGGNGAVGQNGGTGGTGQVLITYPGLPSNGSDLANRLTSPQVSDIAGDDSDYFIEYGSEYVISEFQKKWTNNSDTIKVIWKGRSTESFAISPILLQIYNINSTAWETLASETVIGADTDIVLRGTQTSNVSNYYDSNNFVTFRVYQKVV